MNFRNQEMIKLIGNDKGKEYERSICTVFLSSKNINEYLNFKDQIIKNLLAGKLDFKNMINKNEDGSEIIVKQCVNMQKVFKSESVFS